MSFDASQYKAEQRQDWGDVAAGWRKWWPTIERSAQQVSDRLVELADVQPGQHVLDIASGIGEPALTAARRVGESGRVIATDISDEMLAIASERAANANLTNIECQIADAEIANHPDESFDAILCRWGLMYFPNVPSTLTRLRTMLKPGGKLSTAVWDRPERVPYISVVVSVVQKMFQLSAQPLGTPTLFGMADGALEAQLNQAGFDNVISESMDLHFEFQSPAEYGKCVQDISERLNKLLRSQTTERQQVFQGSLAAALEPFTLQDGKVQIPAKTLLAVGIVKR